MSAGAAVPEAVTARRALEIDALSLAAITLLSALPYLPNLGFYSDDWALLAGFAAQPHAGIGKLIVDSFPARPVQGLYLALLFKLFGLRPLGYHIVNIAVLAASAALFDWLLVRLRTGRGPAFAAALLFVLLPQLSTVRAWYAAFQIPLSLALMLISMHCQLSFARRGGIWRLAAAIVTAVLSVAAYEIFAPLLAGFAAGLLFLKWRNGPVSDGTRQWRLVIAGLLVAALAVAAFLYKLVVSGRAGAIGDPHRYLLGLRQLVRTDYDWRVDSGLNLIAMAQTHFVDPVRGWWTGATALLGGRTSVEVAVIAILIGAVTAWRLAADRGGEPRAPTRLLLLGIGAFLLGNATFLVVPSIVFTSTGMGNRVQVAAAIGVAMIFIALIVLALQAVAGRRRPIAFTTVIGIVAAAAFVRIAQIERYWAQAPALQEQVLDAARSDLRDLPAGSTVILDRVCPYHGPAVVFETSWDVAGALSIVLGRPVNADAVSPRMSLTPKGVATSIYKSPSFYPYGPRLYVYDPVKHLLVQLGDQSSAARYFQHRRAKRCPGFVARGAAV